MKTGLDRLKEIEEEHKQTKPEEAQPETSLGSKANTVLTRLGRVATLDFADEIGGGVKELVRSAQEGENFNDRNYKDERDKLRTYFKKTAAENEGLDTAANVGGNIALALTPLGAIGKGVSVGKAALKAGALGAAQGAGESEEDSIKGVAKDAAIGGAISGGLGGATQALSKGLGAAGTKGLDYVKSKLAPKAAAEALTESGEVAAKLTPIEKLKSFAAQAMGVTKDDANALLKNADEIKNLRGTTTQDAFIRAVKDNTKQIKQLSNEAVNKLSNTRDIHVDNVNDVLDKLAVNNRRLPTNLEGKEFAPKEILGVTDAFDPEKEAAINDVRNMIGKMTKNEPNLSQKEIKGVIQQLDNMADYTSATANQKSSAYNNQIKEIRKALDTNLKASNPEYEQVMKKLAPLQSTKSYLGKKFGVLKEVDHEMAFDNAAKKLDLIAKSNKPNAYRTEEKILNRLDPKFVNEMKLRALDARNEGGVTQGSRNTNLGAFTGLALKTAIGGAGGALAGAGLGDSAYGLGAGAVLGATLDKSGRTLGKQLLLSNIGRQGGKAAAEATAKVANVPIEAAIRNVATPGVSKILGFTGTKFFEPLQQALAKGGSAYIEEDFKLSSDPEYRELKRRQNSGKTE